MSVVFGLEKFRDAMKGYEEQFVLIGGGACSLLHSEFGTNNFRATKDLDIVVLSNVIDAGLAKAFWAFVQAGGYECGVLSGGKATYYRFEISRDSSRKTGYPRQIELFARHPDFELVPGAHCTPLPIDDDIRSLSAIILDDGYYEFLQKGLISIDGVLIPDTLHIIPLKMRAHIDNNDLSLKGVRINDKDKTKHRADVIGLIGLLPANSRLELMGCLRDDAVRFLEDLDMFANRSECSRKERVRINSALTVLREIYL